VVDERNQLGRVERLVQIFVGACTIGDVLVVAAGPRRQHQNRNVEAGP